MTLRLPKVNAPENPVAVNWGEYTRRYMNPGELEALLSMMRNMGARFVAEFGCNEGRTAQAALQYVPTITRYIGVDVLPSYKPSLQAQKNEVPAEPGRLAKRDPRFTLLTPPRGTLDLSRIDFPPCDLVFIDGDHSRAVVEYDTQLAYAITRSGGLIVWHDYHDMGNVDVRDVLHDFYDAGQAIYNIEGTWLAFMERP